MVDAIVGAAQMLPCDKPFVEQAGSAGYAWPAKAEAFVAQPAQPREAVARETGLGEAFEQPAAGP